MFSDSVYFMGGGSSSQTNARVRVQPSTAEAVPTRDPEIDKALSTINTRLATVQAKLEKCEADIADRDRLLQDRASEIKALAADLRRQQDALAKFQATRDADNKGHEERHQMVLASTKSQRREAEETSGNLRSLIDRQQNEILQLRALVQANTVQIEREKHAREQAMLGFTTEILREAKQGVVPPSLEIGRASCRERV